MQSNTKFIKNLHLGTSSIVILIVGLTYGINPNNILPIFFDFKVESTDLNNIFRAMMGLYLAIAVYWIVAIFKPSHWRNATLINVIFMGGLAIGRLLSFMMDGISTPYLKGFILELFFMIWGIYNLTNGIKKTENKATII